MAGRSMSAEEVTQPFRRVVMWEGKGGGGIRAQPNCANRLTTLTRGRGWVVETGLWRRVRGWGSGLDEGREGGPGAVPEADTGPGRFRQPPSRCLPLSLCLFIPTPLRLLAPGRPPTSLRLLVPGYNDQLRLSDELLDRVNVHLPPDQVGDWGGARVCF